MAQYTIAEVRAFGRVAGFRAGGARETLRKALGSRGPFDIFLSHSFQDAELILGVRTLLQVAGKSVYVDWIDDPQLDRTHISKSTALKLRSRMDECSSLIYAATRASTLSKWMPWELGYFDGRKGVEAVAVMPLVQYQGEQLGQEYLDLYPKIEKTALTTNSPVVAESRGGVTVKKSIDDLVHARGGSAWRSA